MIPRVASRGLNAEYEQADRNQSPQLARSTSAHISGFRHFSHWLTLTNVIILPIVLWHVEMSNIQIATGYWENYSQSQYITGTLTIDVRSAALLISTLATFITLVGSRFWVLLAFATHQLRSTEEEKDGLHHQHQVVYRNNSSTLAAAWAIFRISLSWRGRARSNWFRMLVWSLPPLISFFVFAAASIFSARVTAPSYAGSQVRVVRRNCGFIDWSAAENEQTNSSYSKLGNYRIKQATAAKTYARRCYGKNVESEQFCNTCPVSQLPYSTDPRARCPFGADLCKLGSDRAYEMTTPWLNSHEHFGINAISENRIEYRKASRCSVLNVVNYIKSRPSTEVSDTPVYVLALGPHTGLNGANFTFEWMSQETSINTDYTLS